jgi:uncharacterized RDD family membrane protein YckC
MTQETPEGRRVIRSGDAPPVYDTAGVMLPRLVAYVVDLFMVAVLGLIVLIGVSLLGLLTFGFAWLLFPIVGIGTAMAYAAMTIGGHNQATIGMRVTGVHVERYNGGAPDGITAAAHCLMFYAATFTVALLALTIGIGILRSDGRMGHDLLSGLIVVKNSETPRGARSLE